MRVAPKIILTPAQRSRLQRLSRARSSAERLKERARIVLLAAEGMENKDIARKLNQDRGKVGRWRQRFAQQGMAGIEKDKSRPGRIAPLSARTRSKIIGMTLNEKPPGATHWSRNTMARAAGVSASSVGRIWAAHGLKPHRLKSFKLSNDKHFEEKLEDIVGPVPMAGVFLYPVKKLSSGRRDGAPVRWPVPQPPLFRRFPRCFEGFE